MDIYECRNRYRISLKKLRIMQRDRVLNVSRDKTPRYWLQAISDIQKGKLSARSIALGFRFPEKLENLHYLTGENRRVLKAHFRSVELPGNELDSSLSLAAPIGAVEKHPLLMSQFIEAVQKLIPPHDVDYYYLAVRILITCEFDFQISDIAEWMTRAFSSIRDEPAMKGWWHTEACAYGKNRTLYHRPRHYDL
jgi:hypothetical protein